MLYCTGEESLRQVALRARRLGLESTTLRLAAETRVETILEEAAAAQARVLIVDSIQTMQTESSESSPGSAVAGARIGGAARAVREGHRHRGVPHRPRDQGGRDRGTAHPRAHGRHRAVLRERPRQPLPRRARRQEPLRRGQRNRRVRDGGTGTARKCAIRPRSSCRGRAQPLPAASSPSRAKAAGRCWSRCRRWSTTHRPCRRGASRWASTRTGSRCCSRCCIGTAAIATAGHDVFVNVVGGVRIGETAADLPAVLAVASSLRGRAARRGSRLLRRARAHRRDPAGAYGEERLREAAKQGFGARWCRPRTRRGAP